jgi:hypothetical protein
MSVITPALHDSQDKFAHRPLLACSPPRPMHRDPDDCLSTPTTRESASAIVVHVGAARDALH